MPRHPRNSQSDHLHLIVRGVGKQILFECEADYCFYLGILRQYSNECNIRIYAYCLMSNHVHLLVYDPEGNISVFMKKMGVSYAGHYNRKYERTGHLFQDRFLSEPIRNEKHLLIVFRYILNNPHKAGICPASLYKWSSYSHYGKREALADTSLICELLGDYKEYEAFIRMGNNDRCMEYESYRNDDEWARDTLRSCLGTSNGSVLKSLGKEERNNYIRLLKNEGLSVRQIERYTGIGRNIIQRV